MAITLNVALNEEDKAYMQRCAAIRQTSVTALYERLIKTIARDKIVLAVLDDDSKPSGKRYHSTKYRPFII
jgi:hypothetical protein